MPRKLPAPPHPATITRAYGVAPDKSGAVKVRVVGWRMFCPACGELGKTTSYGTAHDHVSKHRKLGVQVAA